MSVSSSYKRPGPARLEVAEGRAVVDLEEGELAAAGLAAGLHPPAHAELVPDLEPEADVPRCLTSPPGLASMTWEVCQRW